MGVRELLAWQWDGYERYHQSRTNLLLHIFAVPSFVLASIHLITSLISVSILSALLGLVVMGASIALQGKGHETEEVPPEPFAGPMNAISRIVLEQWITFPRFVLTGGWSKALRTVTA